MDDKFNPTFMTCLLQCPHNSLEGLCLVFPEIWGQIILKLWLENLSVVYILNCVAPTEVVTSPAFSHSLGRAE